MVGLIKKRLEIILLYTAENVAFLEHEKFLDIIKFIFHLIKRLIKNNYILKINGIIVFCTKNDLE